MNPYYRHWAIATTLQIIITTIMGGGKISFLALLLSSFCLATGVPALVGAVGEAIGPDQSLGARAFAVVVAAPAILLVVVVGMLAWVAGWAIAIFQLLA